MLCRYYEINVDIKNGTDCPERIFTVERQAREYFNNIKLSASGVVYKSLTMCTDNGDIVIDSEEV